MIRVMHMPTNGDDTVLDIDPTLEEFQRLVGGMIEPLPHGFDGYCNEEGRPLGLPYNPYASAIVNYDIFGDVVFTGPVDAEGSETDVPEAFVRRWSE